MNKKIEGYWKSKYKPDYPLPVKCHEPWDKDEFLTKLDIVENKLIPISYRGSSTCRCCGILNGSKEYQFKNWIWPEGFRHYIIEHNVKPSDEFIEFIHNESDR